MAQSSWPRVLNITDSEFTITQTKAERLFVLTVMKEICCFWKKLLGEDVLKDSSNLYILGLFGSEQLTAWHYGAGPVVWRMPYTCLQNETNSKCPNASESVPELAPVCLNLVCHRKRGATEGMLWVPQHHRNPSAFLPQAFLTTLDKDSLSHSLSADVPLLLNMVSLLGFFSG